MSEYLSESERNDALRIGLVGDKYKFAYHNSAHFKAAIETLMMMLPAWVDGLANQAEILDVDFRRAQAARMLDLTRISREHIREVYADHPEWGVKVIPDDHP